MVNDTIHVAFQYIYDNKLKTRDWNYELRFFCFSESRNDSVFIIIISQQSELMDYKKHKLNRQVIKSAASSFVGEQGS